MTKSSRTERLHQRIVLTPPADGSLNKRYAVRVLDLSLGGARVAHTEILPANDSCAFQFAVQDQQLTVPARLVWSSVVRRPQPTGGGPLFNSGLAFEPALPATQGLLGQCLGAIPAEAELRPKTGHDEEAAAGEPPVAFSEEAVRAAWAWAGRQCECEQDGHGHVNSCRCHLTWGHRGTNRAGGWEARLRRPPIVGGTETERCEIVCWLCYELDLTVPLKT
jgi:hypothetical protein